ncbi:eukaryotic translation initiation factor 5 [Tanacetum coccineum]
MALQNIRACNNDDAFYRYKMQKMITKIEGRGNGIKTNIVNMVYVAKALARPASYTTKYFCWELGTQTKFDEKTRVSLINGSHDTAKLAGLLENFIKKYVQCYVCGNRETKCDACGFVSDVDMRDKLTYFILKNPPEAKKKSKDNKAIRRAEKERLKEGEVADKALKKISKDGKKTKDEKTTTSKKKVNGSDEDRVSPIVSQTGDKDDTEEDDDDDVQWQTDTSAAAARQRIQEQLSTVTADMVMLTTDEEPVKKVTKDVAEENSKATNGNRVVLVSRDAIYASIKNFHALLNAIMWVMAEEISSEDLLSTKLDPSAQISMESGQYDVDRRDLMNAPYKEDLANIPLP